MIELSERQYKDFQEQIPWNIGTLLPDGRVLGHFQNNSAKATTDIGNDARITDLFQRIDTADKRVLELGCFEGHHTVSIALRCKEVVAVEVRPRNIINTLVRLFVHDINNVKVVMKDVQDMCSDFGRFDILFHGGVLYHLDNPVEHLYKVADLAPILLLDTQIVDDDTKYERADITYNGKTYRAHTYIEGGWDEPLSGVASSSRWLHRDALLQLLKDVGYEDIEETCTIETDFGPRIAIIARRNNAVSAASSIMEKQKRSLELQYKFALESAHALREREKGLIKNEEQKLAEMHIAVERLQRENANLQEKNSRLEENCLHLQNDLCSFRNSKTWRMGRLVVKPLLALKSLFNSI